MAELRKVNQDKKLDPDWGSLFPEESHVIKIHVKKPATPGVKPYYFMMLLPVEENQTSDVLTQIIKEICELILDVGDHYATCELTKEDLKKFKNDRNAYAVFSFDPRNTMDMFWINPPMHLKN